jgi:hypothetical protein
LPGLEPRADVREPDAEESHPGKSRSQNDASERAEVRLLSRLRRIWNGSTGADAANAAFGPTSDATVVGAAASAPPLPAGPLPLAERN